jgi:hypothetical protein
MTTNTEREGLKEKTQEVIINQSNKYDLLTKIVELQRKIPNYSLETEKKEKRL